MSHDTESREQFRPKAHDTEHFLLTTITDSYPKPKWLNHANDLAEDPNSKFIQEHLHEAHDDTCRVITNKYERSGPGTVVDGETHHEKMVEYFAHRISSHEFNGPVKVWGRSYFDKPSTVGEVEYDEPWLVDEFEFTSGVVSKPVKVSITGSYTLANRSSDEHYDPETDLAYALASLINEEVEQFIETGTTYI